MSKTNALFIFDECTTASDTKIAAANSAVDALCLNDHGCFAHDPDFVALIDALGMRAEFLLFGEVGVEVGLILFCLLLVSAVDAVGARYGGPSWVSGFDGGKALENAGLE